MVELVATVQERRHDDRAVIRLTWPGDAAPEGELIVPAHKAERACHVLMRAARVGSAARAPRRLKGVGWRAMVSTRGLRTARICVVSDNGHEANAEAPIGLADPLALALDGAIGLRAARNPVPAHKVRSGMDDVLDQLELDRLERLSPIQATVAGDAPDGDDAPDVQPDPDFVRLFDPA